jgi:hypothetical protein
MNDVALAALLHRQTTQPEDGEHRLILGKDVSLEARNSQFLGDLDEMTQEQGRDIASRW